ncbi:MAG: efflux RND transporter periplasmic adaptor subunit [Planctomycetota bacterium]|nr:efflux RND transporter periplasmic adaptor subunit [Planctomycetota bacterium]
MKKNTKRILLIAVVIAVAAGAAAAWYGLSNRDDQSQPQSPAKKSKPLQVQVKPVWQGEIVQRLELSGEVVATYAVVIAATKEGPIEYCPWREGDKVQGPRREGNKVVPGERLVEIDREVLRAEVMLAEATLTVARARLADLKAGARPEAVQKAEASVRRWEATLAEARRNFERLESLSADGHTSQQSLDQARERMEVAQAELASARENLRMLKAEPTETEVAVLEAAVKEAEARLALVRAHLAENVITAPFDGIITAVHVRPGDLVTPRSPLLEMYAPDSLVIRFSVPESQSSAVRTGFSLKATLDALNGRAFDAEITRIYPQLDQMMRTRTVEAKLTEPAEILPNMFARLSLELKRAEKAVLVPAEAVMTSATGEHYVFVVDKDKARRRTVVIGIEENSTVQALSGITPGEQVVVAGQAALRDGRPVRQTGQKTQPGDGSSQGNGQATGTPLPKSEGGR